MAEAMIEHSVDTDAVLRDYRLAVESREASLIGRREVLTGKAKFGIFGDGKEVAQVALARAFRPGDWRSGYYRDQTLMLALDALTLEEFFAQLYARADLAAEPSSAGRQMNAHFATHSLDDNGSWRSVSQQANSSPDMAPTGSQMPRLVGLGYASRLYRDLESLHHLKEFSHNGDEVAWGTIGNASCAEGMFWESVNAIGVLHAPAVIVIYDDGYGISVPNEFQISGSDLSKALSGFQREPGTRNGFDLYTVRGWDYPALVEAFQQAAGTARAEHVPAIVHVTEVTQPQGHSTSGSHERYKSDERLKWEEEYDPIGQMRAWMLHEGIATAQEVKGIERRARQTAEQARKAAWDALTGEMQDERAELVQIIEALEDDEAIRVRDDLLNVRQPLRKDMMGAARRALFVTRGQSSAARARLQAWRSDYQAASQDRYGAHLFSQSPQSALKVAEVKAVYADQAPEVPGYELLNKNFDALLAAHPEVVAFGEDLGKLGGVNQAFAGLQEKYGELRVSDTGIREATIIGQAIGLALRGLRPIAEIQYLDYLLYAIQILSDDLATVRWRTYGRQQAPVIVRTRGHRLEGVWHSGSPMGSIVHLLRGMHVLVPRNMTQAAGFYNTLIHSDDPGLIVEVLNGYRLKERLPENLGEYTIPLGVPEIVREGEHVTVVTYGPLVRMAQEAADTLAGEANIAIEIIDVRSLLPFDRPGLIGESLRKTSRVLFLDEDVPGGASAYMMQQVLEGQGGFWHLDSAPRTLTSQPHRPAYGSDGNYFSKPGVDDIVEAVYDLMNEFNPAVYPGV